VCRTEVLAVQSEQTGQVGVQPCIDESSSLSLYAEQHQGVEKGLGTHFVEAQRRGTLHTDFDGVGHLIESVFADGAVVRDGLDVEQTSVGLKADLLERGQFAQGLADPEVVRLVDSWS